MQLAVYRYEMTCRLYLSVSVFTTSAKRLLYSNSFTANATKLRLPVENFGCTKPLFASCGCESIMFLCTLDHSHLTFLVCSFLSAKHIIEHILSTSALQTTKCLLRDIPQTKRRTWVSYWTIWLLPFTLSCTRA